MRTFVQLQSGAVGTTGAAVAVGDIAVVLVSLPGIDHRNSTITFGDVAEILDRTGYWPRQAAYFRQVSMRARQTEQQNASTKPTA